MGFAIDTSSEGVVHLCWDRIAGNRLVAAFAELADWHFASRPGGPHRDHRTAFGLGGSTGGCHARAVEGTPPGQVVRWVDTRQSRSQEKPAAWNG